MRHSLFYPAIFGFIAGIFVCSVYALPFSSIFFTVLVSFALFTYAFQARIVFSDAEIKQYTHYFLVTVFLVGASFGFVRYAWFASWQGDRVLRNAVDTKIAAEGVVVDESSVKETSAGVTVELDRLFEKKIQPTKILVSTDPYSYPKYGDRVKISGKLLVPQNIAGADGRVFDYRSYLAKERIFYVMKFAGIDIVSQGNGNPIKSFILSIKARFLHALDMSLPFPESRLAAGLVVAGKQALPKSIQDEFAATGTSQVVVLSGYNVTLVAETISALLSFLPTALGAAVGGAGIVLFAIAAGGSATVVRAVVMVMIALLGKTFGRKYNVGRALIISAVLMLLFNPMLLVFDPSFQLSFLATIGLIYVSPLFEKYAGWIPEWAKLREVLVSTVATQVFVTPFIIYLTGTVSLVAVPANLALFLLTPITMFLSFLTGMLGLFSAFFAWPVGFISFVLLKTMLAIVHGFSQLSFASLAVNAFPLWLVFAAYGCYAVVLYRFYFEA